MSFSNFFYMKRIANSIEMADQMIIDALKKSWEDPSIVKDVAVVADILFELGHPYAEKIKEQMNSNTPYSRGFGKPALLKSMDDEGNLNVDMRKANIDYEEGYHNPDIKFDVNEYKVLKLPSGRVAVWSDESGFRGDYVSKEEAMEQNPDFTAVPVEDMWEDHLTGTNWNLEIEGPMTMYRVESQWGDVYIVPADYLGEFLNQEEYETEELYGFFYMLYPSWAHMEAEWYGPYDTRQQALEDAYSNNYEIA